MSSVSGNQVTRLLALVPYLLRHDGARVRDVAREFGVTPRQLRQDLHVLHWCALPQQMYGDYIEIDLQAVDGNGTIHLSNADYFSRPLRFTTDEAVALLLALRSLREVADPEQLTAIDSTVDKLEKVAGAGAEQTAGRTEVRVSAGTEEVRTAVHRALRDRHQLDLTYDVASRAETTHRRVDPLRTSVRDGYAYLDAWCHSANGLRVFRMDRIVAAEPADVPVEEHPGVELPDPGSDWFDALAGAPVVRLALAPEAHWVREYYPTVSADDEPAADGTLVVEVKVADETWLRGLLLRLGDAARVVEPSGADQPARDAAAETLAMYASLGL
ncbi:helix-turn-helix transcriptional regulator [Propionibacteriaceae bacterium Y2011]